MAEGIVIFFAWPGSHITLVFLTLCADTKFQGKPFQRGAQNTRGLEKLAISTEIAVYLGNGAR